MKKELIRPLLIGLLVLTGCNNNSETITPKKSDITESVYASGILKSVNQYEVFTQFNGKIEEIFVREGDFVRKGEPLFQIENSSAKLSTDNARISAFSNDYKRNKEKLLEAQNAIELAHKKVINDSLLFVRQKTLWQQNIGSKIELEQRELSFENAKVNLKKAQVTYEDLNRQLKLSSVQSKNNLKIAQSAEKDLTIKSELDGFVYKINAKQGELANSMNPLAVVGQEKFLIEFNVDEFDIVKIRKGQKVLIRMDSYQGHIFEAQVSFIYPMMDERTRSFKVGAIFSKEPDVLYPNLTLEANIVINSKKDILTIPTSYLINESFVMLEDGSVQEVEIGLKDFTLTEILSGIDEHTEIRMPKE
ncbi:efflux RND transporter periplasmic adaptor subunit [Marivirga salinae]|uniref:Efflux RND transporter periplasmic adaptor subunit n=1 Tax=Marivirga salinarum TaxID=3059078 RepID=A0AA51NE00_9BACT|nr:efflux RND transporter periplasmic adaptor subunit [Marivirga sp. BDSF4-3]WMN12116.1 efflux RND transporter periplasmic adaptor subunit [Marivirga sp. BDSF4-3]